MMSNCLPVYKVQILLSKCFQKFYLLQLLMSWYHKIPKIRQLTFPEIPNLLLNTTFTWTLYNHCTSQHIIINKIKFKLGHLYAKLIKQNQVNKRLTLLRYFRGEHTCFFFRFPIIRGLLQGITAFLMGCRRYFSSFAWHDFCLFQFQTIIL